MDKPSPDLIAAGALAAAIHAEIKTLIRPGLNLLEIEQVIADRIKSSGMKPAFLGFHGYPAVSCLSVNSVVVHGIPVDYQLQAGDIISVDLGVEKNGWIVDTALTHPVGTVSQSVNHLLKTTEQSLLAGISLAKAGNHVGDIGAKVQSIVEKAGFFIIKELTGHGVGPELQMPPNIPNFGRPGHGPILKEGMVLAIEPITALKPVQVRLEADDWTIKAYPDVVSAHFEHTIFVTKDAPIILTALANSPSNPISSNGLTEAA